MKIVICGFGSAGYAAAMSVKRAEPKTEIVIIDPKDSDLMHPCGLPYALEGIVNPANLLQDIDLKKGGITRHKGKVTEISPDSKIICYNKDSGSLTESYDSLIIATGYRPVIPAVPGIDNLLGKAVFTLADITDLKTILSVKDGISNCVVIGGGAIGIETSYALRRQGKSVILVEMQNQLLQGILDSDISLIAENQLISEGISLQKESTVTAFEESGNCHKVLCSTGTIESEMTIIATGFAPDISIAEKSGIRFNKSGIITDPFLMTSAKDVFAAGDCIAGWSSIDGKAFSSRLATSAYKQGTIAGINSLGGKTEYRGTASTFVTKIGDFEIAGTGFNTETAFKRGFEPLSGKIKSKIRPEYYPDNRDITIKIIFDKNTGLILGAQCAGSEGAASRINIVSMAVEFGITIDELSRTELAYCPSVSEVYDPLLRAVDIGLRRLNK
ncbi:MAG TPA: FAD-dependent oxidoreductase [Spirochaetota bacterium]|nr:FAD-dependent oxidoreductase [Spirochaetota bacterium]